MYHVCNIYLICILFRHHTRVYTVQTLLTYDLVLYIYTAIIKRTRRDPFFMALLYYIIMHVYIYNGIITIIHSNNNVITRRATKRLAHNILVDNRTLHTE